MEFELTSENFQTEVLDSSEPVLVDFFAVWCMHCMMMMPIIEDIADEDMFKVGRVNINDSPELVEKYEIMSVPTLMVFTDGKPAARISGYHTEDEIISFFKSV